MNSILRLLALVLALDARALEEVPFVTTPDHVTVAMLELAKVGPRDFVIDLGSGDGRIVNVAAKKYGARGLGVDIDPRLVQLSLDNAKAAGVAERVEFRVQDLFETDLDRATVVTLYLLPDFNLKLRPKLLELRPGTRIVSHDWDMGDWKPDKTITLDVPDKPVGIEKKSRVHLWTVPAQLDGEWCGTGVVKGNRLRIKQTFQHVQGELSEGGADKAFVGTVDVNAVRGARIDDAPIELRFERRRLLLTRGGTPFSSSRAQAFIRPKGDTCR
jgi:SAM-dependent methyltransferase